MVSAKRFLSGMISCRGRCGGKLDDTGEAEEALDSVERRLFDNADSNEGVQVLSQECRCEQIVVKRTTLQRDLHARSQRDATEQRSMATPRDSPQAHVEPQQNTGSQTKDHGNNKFEPFATPVNEKGLA